MKVYILQELTPDEVPNAKVFTSHKDAATHAQDLVEYVNLTDEAGDEADVSDWDGVEDVDLWDNEGAIVVRLYSVEVQ